MATEIIKTVKPSGGDYTSLAAAEAGEQKDLVAADEQLTIECYAMEDLGNRAYFLNANWTVNATCYVRITVPNGERHHGKWDTNAYRLKISGTWGSGINSELDYTRLEWLQVEDNMTIASGSGFVTTGADCTINGCITKFTGTSTGPTGFSISPGTNGTQIRNCLAFDYVNGAGGRGFSLSSSVSEGIVAYNCGAQNCYTGFIETWFAPRIRNCWAQDCTDGFVGTWSAQSDYNLSDVAADAPGAHSKNSTTVTFVDKANDDFHLSETDTEARNSALNLSGIFIDDLDNNERVDGWDIGPNQYLADESVKTIKPAGQGGNYTTVSAWEVGEAVDLVHRGRVAIGSIEGDWTGITETGPATIDDAAWHTDPTRRIIVRAIGIARHRGKWVDRAYKIVSASNVVQVHRADVEVEGLQIESTATLTPRACVNPNSNATRAQIHDNIMKFTGSATGASGVRAQRSQDLKVYNNIIYGFDTSGSYGIYYDNGNPPAVTGAFYTNTIDDCETGIAIAASVGNTVTVTVKNNIVQNSTTAYKKLVAGGTETWHANSTNNLADDATSPGSNPQDNKTLTFVDRVNRNYFLIETDAAVGNGADLSADSEIPISTDAAGRNRCLPWDIGALEYQEPGEGDDPGVALVSAVMRKNDRRRLLYADD